MRSEGHWSRSQQEGQGHHILASSKYAKMQDKQLYAFVRVPVVFFSTNRNVDRDCWCVGWVGYGSGESSRVRWLPRWHSDTVPWSAGMWVQHLLQLLQEKQRPQVTFCIQLILCFKVICCIHWSPYIKGKAAAYSFCQVWISCPKLMRRSSRPGVEPLITWWSVAQSPTDCTTTPSCGLYVARGPHLPALVINYYL